MTKEQGEIIKEIKIYIHDYITESFDDDGYTRYEISEEEQEFFNNIETVLNMLKEKDKEIEELKQALARNIAKNFTSSMKELAKAKQDLEMLNKGWQIELEKKDNIIDLMVKAMDKIQDPQVCKYCDNKVNLNYGYCVDAGKCKEGIKQYFERKATNNG